MNKDIYFLHNNNYKELNVLNNEKFIKNKKNKYTNSFKPENTNEMLVTSIKNNKENKKENEVDYPSLENDNNYKNGKFESNIYKNQMNIELQNDQLTNKDFNYDVVIDIKSIKDLNKTGWNIIYSGNKENKRKMIESGYKTIISVLGNTNRGKTYILSKLCGENLESGYQMHTKGLNMKFHKHLIFLDTAGTNIPFEKGFTREDHLCQIIKNYIIQTFLIENADILIYVVGMMTSSEQIFLKKIKNLCENKKDLYVIHNLIKCETLADVEHYKENILMQMISVKLVEKRIPGTQNKYYIEEENSHIRHFTFANDKKSKEIDVYNKTTLDYIVTIIKICQKKQNNLFEKLINHIKYISSYVLQKEIIPKIENNLIKCKEEIIPKDIKADEIEYEPLHRYYSKGNYFIIEIQLCSKYDNLVVNHEFDRNSKETKFYISGKRILNIKDVENNYLSNERKNYKNFKIEFKIKLSEFEIRTIDKEPESLKMEYGILFIIYKCK